MTLPALTSDGLRLRPVEGPQCLRGRWNETDVLVIPNRVDARYAVGYAASDAAVEAAQRLRYRVFNIELGEGFPASHATGRDCDDYDDQMTHLILIDRAQHVVAGTYRLQTARQARTGLGLYCAGFFDLAPLEPHAGELVELGRACLDADHRTLRAILALWHGIAHFVMLFEQRYLFGCCSLSSQDPGDAWRAMKTIRAQGGLRPGMLAQPLPHAACGSPALELDPALGGGIALPKLFRTYLKLGARVVSLPAIDRAFGTIDFLVFLDGREMKLSQFDVLN